MCLTLFLLTAVVNATQAQEKRLSIMGLGDSITEGGNDFESYLYPLWQMLQTEGYDVTMIGPRHRQTQAGVLSHCGFSGKPVEFLEARIDSIYRLYPADIVLLHAGHNHFADQHPVDGMIRAYENIVRQIWAVNPEAWVLIAQVTPSGKLPKYSYIPELNQRIAQMVKATDDQRLILVDMASGHDWQRMTIHDKVHPNAVGAQYMAKRWLEAIKKVWKPCQKKPCDNMQI